MRILDEKILIWLRNGFYKVALQDDTIDLNQLIFYTMQTWKLTKEEVWDYLKSLKDNGSIDWLGKPSHQMLCWYKGNVREVDNKIR